MHDLPTTAEDNALDWFKCRGRFGWFLLLVVVVINDCDRGRGLGGRQTAWRSPVTTGHGWTSHRPDKEPMD
jgi:hypothetical protein